MSDSNEVVTDPRLEKRTRRRFRLKLRIREFTQLREALNKLQSLPNIVLARRVGE